MWAPETEKCEAAISDVVSVLSIGDPPRPRTHTWPPEVARVRQPFCDLILTLSVGDLLDAHRQLVPLGTACNALNLSGHCRAPDGPVYREVEGGGGSGQGVTSHALRSAQMGFVCL